MVTVRDLAGELDNASREFYEFVMPAVDMVEEGNELVVTMDLPGFAKKDIRLEITDNILSISAKRKPQETSGTVHYLHRPLNIHKKVLLPLVVKEQEQAASKASYVDGVLKVRIAIPASSKISIS
jgi:HSP20 family molecular chaperone IbpA